MNSDHASIAWPELVFDADFMSAIDRVAERRFGAGGLAEEAATYVVDYLSADNWQKCRAFQGKSKPKTFLVTLVGNAVEEFSRKRFGRPRPPVWLQELGETWVKLWRSLCLERQALPSIIDRFVRNGFREPERVEQAAVVIKARIPTCGQSSRDGETVDDIDALSDAAQAEAEECCGDELTFDNPFHAEILLMMRAIVSDNTTNADFQQSAVVAADRLSERNRQQLDSLREALQLTDQEKIMLRMIYVEGLSKTATSKALGLAAHQAGRIVNDALQRISEALHVCGLALDDVLELS